MDWKCIEIINMKKKRASIFPIAICNFKKLVKCHA